MKIFRSLVKSIDVGNSSGDLSLLLTPQTEIRLDIGLGGGGADGVHALARGHDIGDVGGGLVVAEGGISVVFLDKGQGAGSAGRVGGGRDLIIRSSVVSIASSISDHLKL